MNRKIAYRFLFRISQGTLRAERGYGQLDYYLSEVGKDNVLFERPTGIKCFKDDFDALAQKFVGEDAKFKNIELLRIKYQLEEAILSFETTGSAVLMQKPVKKTDGKIDIRPRTLLEVIDEFITFQAQKIRKEGQPKHLGNIELSTFRTYQIRRDRVLIPYLQIYGLMDVFIHDIDAKFLESFDIWITSNPSSQGRNRGQLWATKCIKFVKQVLNFAVFSRYLKTNLANFYRTKKETIKPVETLSPEDIEKLENCEFMDTSEQEVLDAFLFCVETFMHFGDYSDLQEKHIRADRDGQKWVIKTRKKAQEENRQIMRVPLTPKALELMEKYGGVENMPRKSNSTCSTVLRRIAERAGLGKPIKFKMSRSSGISQAFNEKLMRAEDIAVIAGWEGIREMKSYLQVDLSKVKDNFLNPKTPKTDAGIYAI